MFKTYTRLENIKEWESVTYKNDRTVWKTLVGGATKETNSCDSKDLSFGVGKLEPGEVHLLHHHSIESEIYYVLSGRAKITAGDEVIDAGPDTCVYIPVGMKHAIVNDGKETFNFIWVYNKPYEWTLHWDE